MRVLIADDDPVSRRILSKIVEDMGLEFETASDGEEASEKLRDGGFHLAVLDWMMPGRDGVDICREMMESDEGRLVYIIMMSSKEGSEDITEALRAGASDYIVKHNDPLEVRARIGVGLRTARLEHELAELNERLRYLVRTDSLTGLLNHAAILSELASELERGRRESVPTGVLMLDLDHFKAVNDTYGHQVGDSVLDRFARLLERNCRPYDRVGRYGGEEFLVVLPGSGLSDCIAIGERLRLQISEMSLEDVIPGLSVTCSGGACASSSSLQHSASLVAAADAALYRAKKAGRNMIKSCRRER